MIAPYAKVTNNNVLNYMLRIDGCSLDVETFVEFNWFGEKELSDLEGEDFCQVQDFLDALETLRGEE